jgi:hypothetical protein
MHPLQLSIIAQSKSASPFYQNVPHNRNHSE